MYTKLLAVFLDKNMNSDQKEQVLDTEWVVMEPMDVSALHAAWNKTVETFQTQLDTKLGKIEKRLEQLEQKVRDLQAPDQKVVDLGDGLKLVNGNEQVTVVSTFPCIS